ncbi:MAG: nitroreductase family protein [Candidatus Bathyarchaeia archaeon]|jgi:nitroreductase
MNDVLKIIEERHSSRVPFDPNRAVPKEKLTQILEAARWTPTGHNMQNYEIIVIDDKALLEKIGAIKTRVLEEFLRDNYEQLSFSEEELERKKVGILAAGFPPDWVDPAKISQIAQKAPPIPLSNNIRGSTTLLMVFYDPNKKAPASAVDVYGFMSLGCLMENIWLAAQSLGISMQVLSLSATASVEEELKQLLGVPESLKIAYTIRLGYPTVPVEGLRVRRDIADFTHHNKYGNKGIQ